MSSYLDTFDPPGPCPILFFYIDPRLFRQTLHWNNSHEFTACIEVIYLLRCLDMVSAKHFFSGIGCLIRHEKRLVVLLQVSVEWRWLSIIRFYLAVLWVTAMGHEVLCKFHYFNYWPFLICLSLSLSLSLTLLTLCLVYEY